MLKISVRKFPVLYHVGTLNPEDKKEFSLEGQTLSVSVNPYEWCQIAQLGNPDEIIQISNDSKINMVDIHQFVKDNKSQIEQWAIERELADIRDTFLLYSFDEEGEKQYMTMLDINEAIEETMDEDYALVDDKKEIDKGLDDYTYVILKQKDIVIKPEVLKSYRLSDISNNIEDLAVMFIEDRNLNIDGVWWNEQLDVSNYSAPRGGIFLTRLKDLNINRISSSEIEEIRIPECVSFSKSNQPFI